MSLALVVVVIVGTFGVAFPLVLVGALGESRAADQAAARKRATPHASAPVLYPPMSLDPAYYRKTAAAPPAVSLVKRVSLVKQ